MDSIRITDPKARFLVPDNGMVERAASSVKELEGTLGGVFDTAKGKWVKADGKKRTGHMDWFRTSVEELYENPSLIADETYHAAGRFFCLEIPGETAEWRKTISDKIEEFKVSDDTFTSFDRGQHRAVVTAAQLLGRPVPTEVLADYGLAPDPQTAAATQDSPSPVVLPVPYSTGSLQLGLFPEAIGGK